jgi:hypothetical protein
MTGRRRHHGAGGRGSGRAGGHAAVCLVAAAGLVLGGATAQNGIRAPHGHRRAEHGRVSLLADGLLAGQVWSGYVIGSGDNWEVAADFTVPTLVCQSWQNGPGSFFWAGIQSTEGANSGGSSGISGLITIVQDGIKVWCLNGQPQYQAWVVQDPEGPRISILPNPVQPNDTIFANVVESGGQYWQYVDDETQNWTVLESVTGIAASNNTAAVAAESFDGGAYFYPVAVTGAQVNGLPLARSNPGPQEQNPRYYNGTAGLDPGPLDASGQDFNFSWNGPPNLAPSP